jgi:hypothetical protein
MKSSTNFKAIIDNIEHPWAILELPDHQETINIPAGLLPESARESDCLSITITIDRQETAKRVNHIKNKIQRLIDR